MSEKIVDKIRRNIKLLRRELTGRSVSVSGDCLREVDMFGVYIGSSWVAINKEQYNEALEHATAAHERVTMMEALCPFPGTDLLRIREYLDQAIIHLEERKDPYWKSKADERLKLAEFTFRKMTEKL